MKTHIRYFIAFILTMTVIGTAQANPVWAGPQPSENTRPNSEIGITEDGEYTIGGLCLLRVSYKEPNLSDKAAVDIPAEISREVTFSYPGNMYLAGCHFTHMQNDVVKTEMTPEQGDWQVCFGDRPGEDLTIYYYTDEAAATGQAEWLPLPTIKTDDSFVCASAMFSGVYAPVGVVIPQTGVTASLNQTTNTTKKAGSVPLITSTSAKITEGGIYGAGGICELKTEYYIPGLSNELHVEEDVEISAQVPFPDNAGLLYLPGCHVFHYKTDKLVDEVTSDEGRWEICFAAVPGKETTIYFYYSQNDANRVTSVWTPLETRVEGGTACAPQTNFTGVYTPVGK
jgi:hypothetical protein